MSSDRDMPLDTELIKLGSAPDSVTQDFLQSILADGDLDASTLVDEISRVEEHLGSTIYSDLIFALANLRFAPEDSKRIWTQVVTHHAQMEQKLGGTLDIRVALISHLLEHNRTLDDPKVIGMHLFQNVRPRPHRDELTGLFGPALFRESLGHELFHSERTGKPLSLVLVNVDDLKQLNHSASFEAGNHVLRELSQLLNRRLRRSDIACRSGIEDFGLILPHTGKSSAEVVSERAREAVEQHIFHAESDLACSMTVSMGIATFPADADNVTELIRQADRALYMAKSGGKNQVALFGESRRSFGRVQMLLPGTFRTFADTTRTLTTVDISEGGMLFRTDAELRVGSVLQIQIDVEPEQTIAVLGRVVYVENGGDGTYRTGIDLCGIPGSDRHLLTKLIREASSTGCPVEASPD